MLGVDLDDRTLPKPQPSWSVGSNHVGRVVVSPERSTGVARELIDCGLPIRMPNVPRNSFVRSWVGAGGHLERLKNC